MSEITKREAAEKAKVSVKTIERWIAEGRIEAYRYGPRLVRIESESLEKLRQPIHPNYSTTLGV